jgi:WD40 repeat protein
MARQSGACLLVVFLVVPAAWAQAEPPGEKGPGRDLYGDPLPPGALARLGTVRFRHAGSIHGVAFAPDGKTVASVGSDGIRLWEAATGQPVRLLGEQAVGAYTVAFSSDGATLATGWYDKAVRLWDVATGKELRKHDGHQGGLHAVCLSRDGQTLAAAGNDGAICLWDLTTGTERRRLEGHEDQVNPRQANNPTGNRQILGMALSSDGKILASTCFQDRRLLLWEVATGRLLRAIPGQDRPYAVAFSPNGQAVAVGGCDCLVRLYEVATGRELRRFEGHQGDVFSVAFSPHGKHLASGARGSSPRVKGGVDTDSTVRVWDVETGKGRPLPGPSGAAQAVAFSPDGKTLAAGGLGTTLCMLDLATGTDPRPRPGHDGGIFRIALAPDGKALGTGGRDNLVHVWDLATSREVQRLAGHLGHVSGLAFTPDGKTLVSAGYDGMVRLWDPAAGKELRQLARFSGWHYDLALTPDGRTLALANGQLVDLATGKELRLQNDELRASRLAFSPDGRRLGLAGGSSACLCDPMTGKQLCQFTGHEEPPPEDGRRQQGVQVACLTFSPDGSVVASGGSDHLVFVWDAATGKPLRRLAGHANPVVGVAFSPDGRTVASASGNLWNCKEQTVRLWEVATGQECRRFAGHQAQVTTLAWAADGRTIFSGSEDGTALIWDVTGLRTGNPEAAGPRELEALWKVMAGADAARAHAAIWALIARPQAAVPFLAERLRPVAAPHAPRIERLLADLDSKQFATREKATQELEAVAELAGPALRKALTAAPPLEVRQRLESLLAKLDGPVRAAETVRGLRAVEVLEYIGTPDAQRVLAAVAQGTSEARLTQDAKGTLERLARRVPPR